MTAPLPTPEAQPSYWARGAELLHQQCWCWGQDIRRPSGNLLLDYGFLRNRPPEGERGSSCYRLRRDGVTVRLWGFGVCYSRPACGGIYLNRYCFVPRWIADEGMLDSVWQDLQLDNLRRPETRRQIRRSRRLLQSFMRWVAGYERWVEASQGPGYRPWTLREWTRTSIPAARMSLEWELLARHVEEPPP